MGRPKLYTTPEERVLAARSYQAKYYAKNRKTINKKLSEKCKEEKALGLGLQKQRNSTQLVGKPSSKSRTLLRRPGRPRVQCSNDVASLMGQPGFQDSKSDIKSALKEVIGTSSHERLHALCEGFLSSGQYTKIYDTLTVVEGLDAHMQKLSYKNWISPDTMNAPETSLTKSIRTVVKVLEDLLMNAMEGTDVKELARRGMLLYQVAPDVTI
ncbi:hypothetical protein JVT61DRAFT_11378 [Boletus reticuloceps]|uniref:Uncharacterized protein n=1 Tax=Boletus reticuloceps TaxID=495285 RepID=A0A8I3A4Q4_9AGAM|nr:hypothetical protein JVT61DRAFT_11378 [Boletus reticuloceps]